MNYILPFRKLFAKTNKLFKYLSLEKDFAQFHSNNFEVTEEGIIIGRFVAEFVYENIRIDTIV